MFADFVEFNVSGVVVSINRNNLISVQLSQGWNNTPHEFGATLPPPQLNLVQLRSIADMGDGHGWQSFQFPTEDEAHRAYNLIRDGSTPAHVANNLTMADTPIPF